MRLADLLSLDVVDEHGQHLGRVHDVRLRLDDGLGGGHRLTVDGVITGAGALTARLGYAYGDVRGPWPLSWLLQRLATSAHYIDWDRIESFDDTVLTVRGTAADLPHPAEAGGETG